jgi:hypothetical protein
MRLKDYPVYIASQVLSKWPKKIIRFFQFWREFYLFSRSGDGRFSVKLKDAYPFLMDKTSKTPFDQHYTYHPAWAARKLAQINPPSHVDISSILSFGTIVSAFVPIKFYDYRPAEVQLKGWEAGFADLKKLSFENNSIVSLSCMHTIEHIGLGRYGDEIDALGDIKAAHELKRVLQPGGHLLFVTPVGLPRIEYNAHRIYSYEQIIDLFSELQLREFSLIPDTGGLIENADPGLVAQQKYGCGCFWFQKI